MANRTLSDLPSASALVDGDLTHFRQSNTDVKATSSQVRDYVFGEIDDLTQQVTLNNDDDFIIREQGSPNVSKRVAMSVITDYIAKLAFPVGMITDYAGISDPNSIWAIANYRTLSQSTYSDLFSLIGHRYAKTKSDRDTAEGSSLFYIPDSYDSYLRGGKRVTFANTDINTSTDQIAISSHGFTRDGTPVRFFTDGSLPSVISGLTNQSWETIYIRVINASTIELYDTEAHAIDTSGSTGRLDFTDQGSGTHELTQQGILVTDTLQGHWHECSTTTNTWSEAFNGAPTGSSDRMTSTGNTLKAKALETDTINGTPRFSNETRPLTSFASKIIKIL